MICKSKKSKEKKRKGHFEYYGSNTSLTRWNGGI